jgi:hypothetical protein
MCLFKSKRVLKTYLTDEEIQVEWMTYIYMFLDFVNQNGSNITSAIVFRINVDFNHRSSLLTNKMTLSKNFNQFM